MRAGKLRHIIDIEQRSDSQDASGQQVNTWTVFADDVYANVRPLRGEEQRAGDADRNPLTHEIEIRFLSGVLPKMRVNFEGRYFNIVAVRDTEERQKQMFLDCQEGLADG